MAEYIGIDLHKQGYNSTQIHRLRSVRWYFAVLSRDLNDCSRQYFSKTVFSLLSEARRVATRAFQADPSLRLYRDTSIPPLGLGYPEWSRPAH